MAKLRIAITGINGFVGHHLAKRLSNDNVEIIGIGRDENIAPESASLVSAYYQADLVKEWPEIDEIDALIHLAGLAAVGPSFTQPQVYINDNSAMVTNIGEYYLKQGKKPRILVVSSGAVYSPDQPMPISEAGLIGFSSPYAVSKVLTENQCVYYVTRGLDVIIARPFNHIGPGQNPGFILPDFFQRISGLTAESGTLQVGNINTKRDYTDVRDIADAYAKLVLAPKLKHRLYNVCSGSSLAGREILDKLKIAINKPDVQFEIDPSLVRPTDTEEIIGDATRLKEELNWLPTFSIETTIKDFVTSASLKK